jgi:hypothetical protein
MTAKRLPSASRGQRQGGQPWERSVQRLKYSGIGQAGLTARTRSGTILKIRGEGETRTLADMRRSAAVEALAGGAHVAQIGAKLANSLSASQELHRTYLPVDKGAVDAVDAARIEARKRNKNGPRV